MKHSTRYYLEAHVRRYPEMQVTDAVKLLYQSEFGGGHMIADPEKSLQWIEQEWKALTDENPEEWEAIGDGIGRVYLSALNHGMTPQQLNQMFVSTAETTVGTVEGFEQKLAVLLECCEEGVMPFSVKDLECYLTEYKKKGYPPVSHSEHYRRQYHPAYRVVSEEQYRGYEKKKS